MFSVAQLLEMRLTCFVKKAIGDEDGTTVDLVTSASERGNAQVHRVQAETWSDSGTILDDVAAATATGSNETPDPPSLNPSTWDVEETLWIAAFGNSNPIAATVFPTNYTNGVSTIGVSGAGHAGVGSARRNLANASDDPSTFTTPGAAEWVTGTIAIRPGTLTLATFTYAPFNPGPM